MRLFWFLVLVLITIPVASSQESSIEFCIASMRKAIDMDKDVHSAATWYFRATLRMLQDAECIDEDLSDSIASFRYRFSRDIHAALGETDTLDAKDAFAKAQKWLEQQTLEGRLPSTIDPFMYRLERGSIYSNLWPLLEKLGVGNGPRSDKIRTKLCHSRRIDFVNSKLYA